MKWLKRICTGLGALVLVLVAITLVVSLVSRDSVPRQAVLSINLEQGVIESVPDDPLARAMLGERLILRDVVETIDRAAEDDRVKALIARVGGASQGTAAVQELRQAVLRFRESGKPAIAYAETIGEVGPGNQGYYLATAFDEIHMQQSGDIGLVGLMTESLFLGGAFEKFDVEPRFDHRHEYKNAKNMFTETGYTDAHREAEQTLLDDMFSVMAKDIAEARGLSVDEVRSLIDRGPFLGREALDAGLIDGIAYRSEINDLLEERVGGFELIEQRRYLALAGRPHQRGTGVAVIHGTGGVGRGESGFSPLFGNVFMGSDTVSRAFQSAIDDAEVKAILFRVDSPGGSYVASDAILHKVRQARAAGKPVVVSMGNVAASGGYFVAMDADRIIAQPGTITGSIGVLGGKLLTSDYWEERFGIRWESLVTSDNATMYSSGHDYSEQGWQRHQDWLDRVYEDFVAQAAAGRDMSYEELEAFAKGRIWTGQQALERGLVDGVGGYGESMAAIRELLELDADAPLKLKAYPEPKGWMGLLGGGSPQPVATSAAVQALESIQPLMRQLRRAGIVGEKAILEADIPEVK
ncbi:S49 family peptidase [Natronospira bacteriovora]|uniref:S49 family peptidase n=1 Tax=Natronospira bacteriovora TaxID=3069753 RepID=A0ABU0W5C7_9GAMM|nr:S49 family peptidase [Natronospira sp. AB-CW4]MDQ2068968.1 S49 family peptidase [Natronospira sp. AB-CW4]